MRGQMGQPARPYRDDQVDAGNTLVLDCRSLDFDSALEAPSSMRYRIDNLTDNVVVRNWTTVNTPASEQEITISADDTAMYSQWRDSQVNQVTVEATYADGSKAQATAVYEVFAVYQAAA